MQDKELMENLLLVIKGECDLMLHGAIESSTPNVHSTFKSALDEMVTMQNEIYSKMSAKGWYPSQKAEPQKIDTLKQKYASMS